MERWTDSRWETVTEAAWGRAYVRAVLACLVSSPSRRLGREQLIDALWPDLDLAVASSRLDRVLYDLRELLEPERDQQRVSMLLPSEREWVMLAPQSQVWVDADAFEHLLRSASGVSSGATEERLLEALQLYDGPFLHEERAYTWTQGRRASLEHSVVSALLQLADLRIARLSLLSALEVLDRLLVLDPANEAAVRRQMDVLLRLGRRGECLTAYKRLEVALERAFQVVPLPVLRTLYESVCAGSFPGEQEEVRDEVYVCSPPASEVRDIPSPLVGRERERALLQHMLARTEYRLITDLHAPVEPTAVHSPQAVVLLGQAGIGKTRLVQEIRDEAGARGWRIASHRVYDVEPSIPYRLWTEVLRSLLSHVESQEVRKHPLLFTALSVLVPELQERFPEIPQLKEASSHQLQLWDAVYETLRLVSTRVPLMICVDDLHSCDTDSLKLLSQVAYRLRDAPVFFLMTSRESARDVLPSLLRTDTCAALHLSPLSGPDITHLVSSLNSTLSQKRIRCIERCANGNPSIASHYAQVSEEVTLVQEPVLADVPAQVWWHRVAFLPDAVEATFEQQMSGLSRECQHLLRRASVFGCTFSAQQLVSLGGTAYDADTYIAYLEEALSAGILVERGARVSVEYAFWHPLLCSFLYRTLSAGRRAFQHRTIADGLRQDIDAVRGAAGSVTLLLYHLVESGADAQLVELYSRYATQHHSNDLAAKSAPTRVGVLSPSTHKGERVSDVLVLMSRTQPHGGASIRGSP